MSTSESNSTAAAMPLTDEELKERGMKKVHAYVFDNKSKDAMNSDKRKKENAEKGIRQLNLEVPDDPYIRKTLNKFGKRLVADPALIRQVDTVMTASPAQLGSLLRLSTAVQGGGVRCWVLRIISYFLFPLLKN